MGILSALGASPAVTSLAAPIVSIVGIVGIIALRRRERAAWAVVVATGLFASLVVNLANISLLLAAFVVFDTGGVTEKRTLERK